MAWAKLDDRFHDNRKIRRVWRRQPEAVGLHVMALTYSAGHLTDGFVDEDFVEDRVHDDERRAALVGALVEAGLWHAVEDGWEINDFTEFNMTREKVEEQRAVKAEAGRKGAIQKHRNSQSKGAASTESGRALAAARAVSSPAARTSSAPDPTRPVPKPKKNSTVEPKLDAASMQARELFADWQERCGHPNAKPTRERLKKIEARLAEGYTSEQIQQAISGAARSAFVNEQGKKFDDIELICRTGSKLEDFIARAEGGAARPAAQQPVDPSDETYEQARARRARAQQDALKMFNRGQAA